MFIGATKKKSLLFGKDDTDFVRDSHKNDLLHDGDQTNRYFGSFSKDSDDDMSFILDNEPPPKVQGPDYAHATYDITSKLREDSQISSEAGDRDDYLNSWIVEMKEHPHPLKAALNSLYAEPAGNDTNGPPDEKHIDYFGGDISFMSWPELVFPSIFDNTIRRGGEEKDIIFTEGDAPPEGTVQGPDYAHATYDITSKLREDSQISSEAGDRDDYLNSWIVEMKEHPLYMEPTEPLEYSFYNPDWADASIFDDTIRRGGEEKYHILKVQGPDHVHATYDITSKLPEDSQISFEGGDVQLGFTAGDVQVGNFAFEVQLVEDDSITLTGVDAASLEASDFAFA